MPLESGIKNKSLKLWYMGPFNITTFSWRENFERLFAVQICHGQTTDQVFRPKSLFYSEYFLQSFLRHFRKRHNPNTEDNQGTITKYLCTVPLIEVISPWEHITVIPPEENAEHTHSVTQAQKPPFRAVWVSSFQRYLQGSTTCSEMPTRWKSQLSISPRNFLNVSTLEHKHWDTPEGI